MDSIEFQVHGADRVQRGFERLHRAAADLRDPLEEIGDLLLADVEEDFATRGHGRWRALDPDYEAWKRREFPARPPLVLTGTLKRHLTSRTAVHVAGNRLVYDAPADLYKLKRRPVHPDVRRRELDEVFGEWLSGLVREVFRGRE